MRAATPLRQAAASSPSASCSFPLARALAGRRVLGAVVSDCRVLQGLRGLEAAGTRFSVAQMPVMTTVDLNWSFQLEFSPPGLPGQPCLNSQIFLTREV